MSSSYLISLIKNLKEEYKTYYLLRREYYLEKNIQMNEIRKLEIKESELIISKLNEDINNYISKYKQILQLKDEIKEEKKKGEEISERHKKFSEFLEKGKNILTNDITYYKKLPYYSNKKLKTAKISPLDLINFTLRISQQNKAPKEGEIYFQNYLPNDKNNLPILYRDYFIKNKNSFIHPYPDNFFGMKNTILRFDLSDKNRLLPPKLESPDPSNINQKNEILSNKGKDLIFKYPKENAPPGIFFKYSKDPNVIPSSFSGEEYKDYQRPNLEKDCIIKVCTCLRGFKDSKIITFKFAVDSNEEEKLVKQKPNVKKGDFVIRPEEHIDPGSLAFQELNSSSLSLQGFTSRQGSSYEPIYYNPGVNNEDDEDEI